MMKQALITGPRDLFPSCAASLEGLGMEWWEEAEHHEIEHLDRVVLLPGWEGNPDSRRYATWAIGHGVKLYDYVQPLGCYFLADEMAFKRMKLAGDVPAVYNQASEPDWEFADIPAGYLAVALLAVTG